MALTQRVRTVRGVVTSPQQAGLQHRRPGLGAFEFDPYSNTWVDVAAGAEPLIPPDIYTLPGNGTGGGGGDGSNCDPNVLYPVGTPCAVLQLAADAAAVAALQIRNGGVKPPGAPPTSTSYPAGYIPGSGGGVKPQPGGVMTPGVTYNKPQPSTFTGTLNQYGAQAAAWISQNPMTFVGGIVALVVLGGLGVRHGRR